MIQKENILGQINLYSDTAFNVIRLIDCYFTNIIYCDGYQFSKYGSGNGYLSNGVIKGATFSKSSDNSILVYRFIDRFTVINNDKKLNPGWKSSLAKKIKLYFTNIVGSFDKTDETKHHFIIDKKDEESKSIISKFDLSIKDVACVYDLLMDHTKETLKRIYGNTFVDNIVGRPFDPFIAQQIEFYEDEIKQIDEDLANEFNKFKNDCNSQLKINRNAQEQKTKEEFEKLKSIVEKNRETYKNKIVNL